jgi:hypothetical protein
MRSSWILIPALALALARPAHAQESHLALRALGLWSGTTSHDHSSHFDFTSFATTEIETAPTLELEARPARWLGVELTAIWSRLDQHFANYEDSPFTNGPQLRSRFSNKVDFRTATVGLNVHPLPGRRWDLSFGPFVGESLFQAPSHQEESITWGGALGLDWPLGAGRWALNAQARYQDTKIPENFSFPERHLQLWWTGAGLAYRFGGR